MTAVIVGLGSARERLALRAPPSKPIAQDARPKAAIGRRQSGPRVLKPVHPNVGIEADYRRRLDALIKEMADSVLYWVKSAYRRDPPKMAQDELAADTLRRVMRELSVRWQEKFDELAPSLAEYFSLHVQERSDAALRKMLHDAGFTVRFKMTPAQRDILKSTINQNVSLIKSIPSEYLTQVEGSVMRSVQAGRDLGALAKELQSHYGVTKRRAALIARDQNNKATSAMQRGRQTELGITEAVWLHSHGGKEPRPTHVAMNGKRYDIAKGMWDPAVQEYIWPGQLINCRCVAKPVIEGFS